MKEAAGEANLTVVAIILIGVIVAVATPIINNLMTSSACRACCTDAGGVWDGGSCKAASGNGAAGYNASAYQKCAQNADANCN